jgi:hypothetical protein
MHALRVVDGHTDFFRTIGDAAYTSNNRRQDRDPRRSTVNSLPEPEPDPAANSDEALTLESNRSDASLGDRNDSEDCGRQGTRQL